MKGYQIQIIKAKLPTYWYANRIDEIYWASVDFRITEDSGYQIIHEGVYNEKCNGIRWVNKEDCVVLKESEITVKEISTIEIIEHV